MFARAHRFEGTSQASRKEAIGLFALMIAVTGLVFWQTQAPLLFVAFLPLTLIALRLSPPLAAASMLVMALIGGTLTLTGHGPVQLTQLAQEPALQVVPPMLQRLVVFNVFLLGAVITVLPISTVVTERRRLVARLRARTLVAQEARRRAEHAADARSRFLAMMSHEMRTPLNGVAGFADLLASRPGLDAEAVRHAKQIRQSSDGLLMLVEDILDFARGDDAVSLQPEGLRGIVEEAAFALAATAEAKGLPFRIDDRLPALSRFETDRRALRQALQPLIANAVKFTVEGGVTVTLKPIPGGVAVAVADTGPGLDAGAHALFEAFEQADASICRDHSGAGLGLALAARNARRLGGSIAVESEPGRGATFTLSLPMSRAADAAEPDAPPASFAPEIETGRAPVVLVVDDHPVNREVARVMLEAFGCEVVEVCDGQEAVDAAAANAFDLVLMDVRMPGMDGLEATRRIRARPDGGDLAIVAMTADAMPEDVARCLASGMNAHMAKPISQAGLLAMLTRALNGDLPAPAVPAAVAA
jgi:signal transduction histidine kinase/ActR/RegA family two-component response regulator